MIDLDSRIIAFVSTASLLVLLGGCGTKPGAEGGSGATETSAGATETSAGATETSAGMTETSAGETGPVCEDSCDGVLVADGVVRCADGSFNRVAAGTFDPTIDAPGCQGDEPTLYCTSDADCDALPHGRCLHRETYEVDNPDVAVIDCACIYSCADDSDCGPGRVCVPPGLVIGMDDWPTCVSAGCVTNDDCECGECGIGPWDCWAGYLDEPKIDIDVECRTESDECRVDADCTPGEFCRPWSDRWACDSPCAA